MKQPALFPTDDAAGAPTRARRPLYSMPVCDDPTVEQLRRWRDVQIGAARCIRDAEVTVIYGPASMLDEEAENTRRAVARFVKQAREYSRQIVARRRQEARP